MRTFITIIIILIQASLTAGAAPLNRAQSAAWIEAEAAAPGDGLTTRAEKLASAGVLLSIHSDKTTSISCQWRFQVRSFAGPLGLFIRYASPAESRLELALDGQAAGTLTLPATTGWGYTEREWAWSFFQVRHALNAGAHTLTLRPAATGSGPVNLDCLGLARGGEAKEGRFDPASRETATSATVTLPTWTPEPGERTNFEIGRSKAVIYGGGAGAARFYPAEMLPAAFSHTVQVEEWPADAPSSALEWIFTGPEGGFTVSVTPHSLRLAQRYFNSYGLFELSGHNVKTARHPEKKWIDDTVNFKGALQAVTVELGANLEVVVKLNGREMLRQSCLFDVHQHQISRLGGEGVLRGALIVPPARSTTVRINPEKKYQTMIGFGGIGTPMAYAQLSPEGKQRWWELIAQYNLLIQREYPIGTRLNPAMDNWDTKQDATPHYYADNFPNGELSDFGYIKTIRKLGGAVWFEFWGLPPWTSDEITGGKKKLNLEKYAAAMVGYCRASREKAGTAPEVLGIQNEVGHAVAEYQAMTLALRQGLDAAGFQNVKIHLSDDGNLKGGIKRAQAVRASAEAWRATDYVASHVYDYQGCLEDIDKFDETIAQWNEAAAGKPFLSTEICVNSTKYQVPSYRLALGLGQLYHKNLALMNAEAICYCWTLLNVVQPSYGWTRTLFVPDLTRGGVPVPSSNQLRVFGAFSRRVKRGMTRVAVESDDHDLLATAFTGTAGATVVLLNRGTVPCRVNVQGLGDFKEMELTDPYHENAVQPAPHGALTVAPGALVTLTSVPLGRLPESFSIEE